MNPTVTDATKPVQHTAAAASSGGHVVIRIRRQDGPGKPARWEEFHVPRRPQMNVISCLQWIAAHPTTADGKATTVPVWESACLEEVCGAWIPVTVATLLPGVIFMAVPFVQALSLFSAS
jgi:hypothetical protein